MQIFFLFCFSCVIRTTRLPSGWGQEGHRMLWKFLFFHSYFYPPSLLRSRASRSHSWRALLYFFFFPPSVSPSATPATPPLRSRVVALMPLWPLGDWGDWELSITGRRAGSLLKRAHVGQKEGWQECGGPAEWREGSQLAGALSGLFYLSGWSPDSIVPAV